MCHEWFIRRNRRRAEDEERVDEELRYLLDEREVSEPPLTVVENEPEERAEKERVEV
jgi:hypothetical protein